MSGWVYAEIYIDAAGSRSVSADFACAEAADLALYGSAVYVGVDIQSFGNSAAYFGRCRDIPALRATWHRHDCDRCAHQPIRAADAGGEAGVYVGFGYGGNQANCVYLIVPLNRTHVNRNDGKIEIQKGAKKGSKNTDPGVPVHVDLC